MLIRELELERKAFKAMIEISRFLSGHPNDLEMVRQMAASIRAIFLQEPSAPEHVKRLLLPYIVLPSEEKEEARR